MRQIPVQPLTAEDLKASWNRLISAEQPMTSSISNTIILILLSWDWDIALTGIMTSAANRRCLTIRRPAIPAI